MVLFLILDKLGDVSNLINCKNGLYEVYLRLFFKDSNVKLIKKRKIMPSQAII